MPVVVLGHVSQPSRPAQTAVFLPLSFTALLEQQYSDQDMIVGGSPRHRMTVVCTRLSRRALLPQHFILVQNRQGKVCAEGRAHAGQQHL